MGTIAARDCLRVLTLSEQVAAACLLAASQALELRNRHQEISPQAITGELAEMFADCRSEFAFLEEDRPLEADLRKFLQLIQNQRWGMYLD